MIGCSGCQAQIGSWEVGAGTHCMAERIKTGSKATMATMKLRLERPKRTISMEGQVTTHCLDTVMTMCWWAGMGRTNCLEMMRTIARFGRSEMTISMVDWARICSSVGLETMCCWAEMGTMESVEIMCLWVHGMRWSSIKWEMSCQSPIPPGGPLVLPPMVERTIWMAAPAMMC